MERFGMRKYYDLFIGLIFLGIMSCIFLAGVFVFQGGQEGVQFVSDGYTAIQTNPNKPIGNISILMGIGMLLTLPRVILYPFTKHFIFRLYSKETVFLIGMGLVFIYFYAK